MRDQQPPANWSGAFAALPQETPPTQGWERLVARMDGDGAPSFARKARSCAWIGLAAAAALVIAIAPWERQEPRTDAGTPTGIAASAAPAGQPLYDLYSESAHLEALLAAVRDDSASSASAALLADELDAQVAAIDASLAQPDLDDEKQLALWQARVDTLRQAAGFESTQRLLASQGRSDVMLVSVD